MLAARWWPSMLCGCGRNTPVLSSLHCCCTRSSGRYEPGSAPSDLWRSVGPGHFCSMWKACLLEHWVLRCFSHRGVQHVVTGPNVKVVLCSTCLLANRVRLIADSCRRCEYFSSLGGQPPTMSMPGHDASMAHYC